MSKTTKKEQYEKLLELLQSKPDIAKGFYKGSQIDVSTFWENASNILNGLGPPTKDPSAWKKVYFDYKCYVKRKLTHNKREQSATGGGPNKLYQFSALEEQVIALTGIDQTVEGVKTARFFGLPSSPSTSNQKENTPSSSDISIEIGGSSQEIGENPVDENQDHARSSRSTNEKSFRPAKETTFDLLKSQVKMQGDFHKSINSGLKEHNENMRELVTNIKKIYRSIDSLANTENKKYKEKQRHNERVEKLLIKKLEIKKQLIEVQLNQFSQ